MSLIAGISIIAHVLNYNLTAHIEHNTRLFTKTFGPNAINYYTIYLILSALLRDLFIKRAMMQDIKTLGFEMIPVVQIGGFIFILGIALNLWTLKSLGFKGMYNGDSFGFLMDAPITNGPFRYFKDPQYFGTTLSLFGSALYYQSIIGIGLTVLMYVTFQVSARFIEGPHMERLYRKPTKIE